MKTKSKKLKKKLSENQIQNKINEFLDEMGWVFEIQHYKQYIKYSKEQRDNVGAEIAVRHKYRDITITIYPCFFELNRTEQCKVLLHELSHIFTTPMKVNAINLLLGKFVTEDQIRYDDERLTETISDFIFNLAIGKRKYVKRAIEKYCK